MSRKEFNEKLKDILKAAMDENSGKIEIDEAMELIRPYFEYDSDDLAEKALKSKTRYIIYSLRDKKGIRTCFADDNGLYMDISTPLNNEELEKIEKQLREKAVGALRAWHKVRRIRKELVGQLSFDELDNLDIDEA